MTEQTQSQAAFWKTRLTPYQTPHVGRGVWQLVNTTAPYVALWALMVWSLSVGYWLTLLLAVPTALFQVRLFILQHDCGHGAFLPSKRANNTIGAAIGVATLVPYRYWAKTHAIHHATSGNLDARSFGDIVTLTAREYLSLPRLRRLSYRLYRHPLVLLVVGPLWQFVIKHRFPADIPHSWKREWASVHGTNVGLALVIAALWLTIGIKAYLIVQFTITPIAGGVGVFLFYVQHQYEDTYWRYQESWDYHEASLQGSSYFVMPRILRWLTGNIAYHHIHHLSSRIPNYHLERCHNDIPELRDVTHLTLGQSFKTLRLTLWDEDARQLIRFRDLPTVRRRLIAGAPNGTILATKPESVPASWQDRRSLDN